MADLFYLIQFCSTIKSRTGIIKLLIRTTFYLKFGQKISVILSVENKKMQN